MKRMITSLFLLTFLASCAQTRLYHRGDNVDFTRQVSDETNYFVSGFLQEDEINAAKICGGSNKIVATETKRTTLNVIFSLITFGIYTPQTHTVYCKK
jgi:hypothetical protein